MSFGSLRMSQINRSFMSTYKGMYEACAITVGNDGQPIYPYYDKDLLKKHVEEYVDKNVRKFAPSYDLSIKFYTLGGTNECSEDDLARTVKIRLKAKVNYLFTFNKEQMFSIQERNTYEWKIS